MEFKVLKSEDQETVLGFERIRSELTQPDPVERELSSWKARWRPEQLNHYLGLGWSFGAWQNDQLIGYILTQPILFFRGYTQSLWVEWISYKAPDVGNALLDSAYRWARDKHFQTVLISEMPADLAQDARMTVMKDSILEIPSARWK